MFQQYVICSEKCRAGMIQQTLACADSAHRISRDTIGRGDFPRREAFLSLPSCADYISVAIEAAADIAVAVSRVAATPPSGSGSGAGGNGAGGEIGREETSRTLEATTAAPSSSMTCLVPCRFWGRNRGPKPGLPCWRLRGRTLERRGTGIPTGF